MRLRPPKHQNIQFRMGSVDFFAFQDSWPNGSAAGWLILPYFFGEKRAICAFRRKYVYSAASRWDLRRGIGCSQEKQPFCFRSTLRTTSLRPSLQTVCFRSTLRPIILRLSPTAAAEWAKPGEIRRGTPSSIRRSDGARRACLTFLQKLRSSGYSYSENAREALYRALPPPILRTSEILDENSVFRAVSGVKVIISRGLQLSAQVRRCPPGPRFRRKYVYF